MNTDGEELLLAQHPGFLFFVDEDDV